MTAPSGQAEAVETVLTFEEWLIKLDSIAGDAHGYGPGKCSEETGAECWRCFWEDGYTPEDALAEDLNCD